MYYYRNAYQPQDTRFIGFGLPFVGGLLGGLLGASFFARPWWGYPPCCPPAPYPTPFYPGPGVPFYPGMNYQGMANPAAGYPMMTNPAMGNQ